MKQYDGILALDLDGVIADTYVSMLRHMKVHIVPSEIKVFKWKYSDMVGDRNLSLHDINGVQVDSVRLISYLIEQCNLAVVVVSSWVRCDETYKQVAQLFKHLDPNLDMSRFIGQTSGSGGEGREAMFKQFIRDNFDKDDPKRIIAIDDSGEAHFPHMEDTTVVPNGRVGFTVDDYIVSLRILDHDDDYWYPWSSKGYLEISQQPTDYVKAWESIFDES